MVYALQAYSDKTLNDNKELSTAVQQMRGDITHGKMSDSDIPSRFNNNNRQTMLEWLKIIKNMSNIF